MDVGILRELLRSLPQFRALYADKRVDEVVGPNGVSYNLWDLEYLYEVSQQRLPSRMAQAIKLCLLLNMRETDAAVCMGIAPSNPVAMYATEGLRRLCDWV